MFTIFLTVNYDAWTNDLAFDASPTWSPDGQWLAYESYRDGNLNIYLIKADGSEGPFQLTSHQAADFAPSWSPGGRHIAFTSLRGGSRGHLYAFFRCWD